MFRNGNGDGETYIEEVERKEGRFEIYPHRTATDCLCNPIQLALIVCPSEIRLLYVIEDVINHSQEHASDYDSRVENYCFSHIAYYLVQREWFVTVICDNETLQFYRFSKMDKHYLNAKKN